MYSRVKFIQHFGYKCGSKVGLVCDYGENKVVRRWIEQCTWGLVFHTYWFPCFDSHPYTSHFDTFTNKSESTKFFSMIVHERSNDHLHTLPLVICV